MHNRSQFFRATMRVASVSLQQDALVWTLLLTQFTATAPVDAGSMAAPPATKPGILVVTLHEGADMPVPPEYQSRPTSQYQGSLASGGGFSVSGSMRAPPSMGQHQGLGSASYSPAGTLGSTGGGIRPVQTNHGRYAAKDLPYALLDFDKVQVFVNAVSGTPENPLWAGENTSYKFDVTSPTELSMSIYLRNPKASPGSGRNEDTFLGQVRINPRFEESKPYVEDPKSSKRDREKAVAAYTYDERSKGQFGDEWHQMNFSKGKVKIGIKYVENRQKALKIEDFDLLKVVGKGSFGKVMQVRKKNTKRIYALKTIRKAHIISRSEVAHTLAERSVLSQINNPFIVPLKFSFQSPEKLYLVLAFVNGGELFHHLQKEQRFDINRSRFYTAELLCALECLHGFNVIYRDLKPENILLDYSGHIALCDFGLCKLDMKDDDRTNSECPAPGISDLSISK